MESPLQSHRRRRRASHFSRCQVSPTDAHRRLFSLLSLTLVSSESTIFASWHTIHDRGESTVASHQHKRPFTTVSRSRTGHPLDRMDELFAFCSVGSSLTASPPSSTLRALLNAVGPHVNKVGFSSRSSAHCGLFFTPSPCLGGLRRMIRTNPVDSKNALVDKLFCPARSRASLPPDWSIA